MAEIRENEISVPADPTVGRTPAMPVTPSAASAAAGPADGDNGSPSGARDRVEAVAGQAGTAAAEVKDHAADAAAGIKEQAGSEVAALRDEARKEARNLAHEARERVGGQVEDAAGKLASIISGAGNELRAMAERSDQPDGPVTEVVRQLADRTESLAQRLETGGYRGVAEDVSRIGRNKPGLFLLAAGVAGFAVGRILRNTDTQALTGAVKGESDSGSASGSGSVSGSANRPAAAVVTPEPAVVATGHIDTLAVDDTPSQTYAPPLGEPTSGMR
jgi:hypothetical protein